MRTTIRPAAIGDFDAVTSLLEALGRPRVTDETRERCRDVFDRQLFEISAAPLVAEDPNGELVGVCTLHFRERLNHPDLEAWIPDLFVTEHARLRGVGRALLDRAERLARERGCWQLALESGYQRAEAHLLYTRMGMRDTGKFFRKPLR